MAPIDITVAAATAENSTRDSSRKVVDRSTTGAAIASTAEPTPVPPVATGDSLTHEQTSQDKPTSIATSAAPSETSTADDDVDLTAVGGVNAGADPSVSQSDAGSAVEQSGIGSNGSDVDEMSVEATMHPIDQKSVKIAIADDAASSNSNNNSPVSINTRLRALMKESRTSVVYGKELTNIRSHRQRCRHSPCLL